MDLLGWILFLEMDGLGRMLLVWGVPASLCMVAGGQVGPAVEQTVPRRKGPRLGRQKTSHPEGGLPLFSLNLNFPLPAFPDLFPKEKELQHGWPWHAWKPSTPERREGMRQGRTVGWDRLPDRLLFGG